MKKLLALCLMLCITCCLYAQPNVVLNKTYGGTGSEVMGGVARIGNKLYAADMINEVSGDIQCNLHNNDGSNDIRVCCLDLNGNIIWQQCYGGSKEDFIVDIISTKDSCLFIAGYTSSSDGDIQNNNFPNNFNCWVFKIDTNGVLLWQNCFGSPGQDNVFKTMQLRNGKYLVDCTSASGGGEFPIHGSGWDDDAWLALINSDGSFDTAYHFGGNDDDQIYETHELPNGDLLSFGATQSTDGDFNVQVWGGPPAYWDATSILCDSIGTIKYVKVYSGDGSDFLMSAVPMADGSFIAIGQTDSHTGYFSMNYNVSRLWFLRIDSSGNPMYWNFYGGLPGDAGVGPVACLKAELLNNGVISGVCYSYTSTGNVGLNFGNSDFWFWAIDTIDNFLGGLDVGGSDADQGPIGEYLGGILFAGGVTWSNDYFVSNNHGNADSWLIGIDHFNMIGNVEPKTDCVKISPNPLTNKFFLAVCPDIIPQQATLFVYDLQGRQIIRKKITNETEEIFLPKLSAGPYMYSILKPDHSVLFTGKLIVQQ